MSQLELTDLSVASATFGTVLVQLNAGKAQGPSIRCRSCVVKPESGNSQPVYVGGANPASSNDYPLSNSDLPIPVRNLNQLFFYSAQANAIVHVMWRL